MGTTIASVQNARVKGWAALLDKKARDQRGQFIVEGTHLVLEALEAGARLDCVVYSMERELPSELASYRDSHAEWIAVSEAVLAKCTDTRTPQGVFAVVHKPEPQGEALLAAACPLLVALDGVQDPGNLGAILRAADAAGADGVIVGSGSADIFHPKTVRATMGALFHLPVVQCELIPWLERAGEAGVLRVSASLQADGHCYETDLTRPVCFVLGNEASGVSPEAEALTDWKLRIPMRGRAESLNVGAACAVLLFEAVRQRYYSS